MCAQVNSYLQINSFTLEISISVSTVAITIVVLAQLEINITAMISRIFTIHNLRVGVIGLPGFVGFR